MATKNAVLIKYFYFEFRCEWSLEVDDSHMDLLKSQSCGSTDQSVTPGKHLPLEKNMYSPTSWQKTGCLKRTAYHHHLSEKLLCFTHAY